MIYSASARSALGARLSSLHRLSSSETSDSSDFDLGFPMDFDLDHSLTFVYGPEDNDLDRHGL